jgi:ADP-ribose pyrophosphatase YjhB (NUDIX family)
MGNLWLSEKDYNFIYSRTPRLCVDLVIKDKRGVVLSLRDIEPGKNTWHLPGGRVKFRESIPAAATRIAKAELGIKIKLGKLIGVMEFPDEIQKGQQRHSISVAFLATIQSGQIKGTWQAGRVEFFKKLPKPTYPEHAKFLKEKKLLN